MCDAIAFANDVSTLRLLITHLIHCTSSLRSGLLDFTFSQIEHHYPTQPEALSLLAEKPVLISPSTSTEDGLQAIARTIKNYLTLCKAKGAIWIYFLQFLLRQIDASEDDAMVSHRCSVYSCSVSTDRPHVASLSIRKSH